MAKLIHTMIRVFDEKRSLAFYKDAFNLDVKKRLDFEAFSLIYLGNDETPYELELTVNHDQKEPYTHGSGYGHIAFTVDDLEATHKRLTDAGHQPRKLVTFAPDGGEVVARFFFIQDPDGYEIEVLQRAGHYL